MKTYLTPKQIDIIQRLQNGWELRASGFNDKFAMHHRSGTFIPDAISVMGLIKRGIIYEDVRFFYVLKDSNVTWSTP